MLALIGIAFGDPANSLGCTVGVSLALGVAGATQDVTIDGWRITSAPVAKQSVMTAISEMGYRVGNLAAGAGALLLADRYGWPTAYAFMAGLMLIGAISAFIAPEPESEFHSEPEASGLRRDGDRADQGNGDAARADGPADLPDDRRLSLAWLHSSAMAIPLFKSLHYSDTEIATVTKLFGFWIALAATFFSAYIIRKSA